MRVFVTGATGFIGSAIVKELISAGHQVTGLARSDASAKKLTAAGAQVLRGDIEDLECLRSGAAAADGAIHTAFYHQIGHMNLGTRLRVMLGGTPSGIVSRFIAAAIGMDRRALETLGRALAGPDRALVAAFATMAMKPGATCHGGGCVRPQGRRSAPRGVRRHYAGAGFARHSHLHHPASAGGSRRRRPRLRSAAHPDCPEKERVGLCERRPKSMALGASARCCASLPACTGEGICGSRLSRGCRRGRAIPGDCRSNRAASECSGCQQVTCGGSQAV